MDLNRLALYLEQTGYKPHNGSDKVYMKTVVVQDLLTFAVHEYIVMVDLRTEPGEALLYNATAQKYLKFEDYDYEDKKVFKQFGLVIV